MKAEKSLNLYDLKNKRLKYIAEQIRIKIERLQNLPPTECEKSKKLICRIGWEGFGFASYINEILWCFIYAFHANKTLIMKPNNYFKWNPTKYDEKWDNIFKPITSKCQYFDKISNKMVENIPMKNNTVIYRKIMNSLPKEFGPEIIKLVESPISWFTSQFVGYIMRPQKRLIKYLEDYKKDINYSHPIVGIHVRRTDKVSYAEALFHDIDEYMISVESFYNKLELTSDIKRKLVYVASDDPTVLPQFIERYPEYEFIGSVSIAESIFNPEVRFTNNNTTLWGVLSDIYLLAESDYIVCTFSSSVSLTFQKFFLYFIIKLIYRSVVCLIN
jgi:glycoprotein 6-alpha-L-fucosyltransferase